MLDFVLREEGSGYRIDALTPRAAEYLKTLFDREPVMIAHEHWLPLCQSLQAQGFTVRIE